MEMNKARNMLEHQAEIFSRPPRTWMQQQSSASRLGRRAPQSQQPAGDHQPQIKKTKHAKKPAKDEDVRRLFLEGEPEFRTRCYILRSGHY